jgi:hypothetical protein
MVGVLFPDSRGHLENRGRWGKGGGKPVDAITTTGNVGARELRGKGGIPRRRPPNPAPLGTSAAAGPGRRQGDGRAEAGRRSGRHDGVPTEAAGDWAAAGQRPGIWCVWWTDEPSGRSGCFRQAHLVSAGRSPSRLDLFSGANWADRRTSTCNHTRPLAAPPYCEGALAAPWWRHFAYIKPRDRKP